MKKKITSVAVRAVTATVCAFLLCAVLAVFAFSAPNKTVAEQASTAIAETIVLDKLEDFRTVDNGDGTYKICGSITDTTNYVDGGTQTSFKFNDMGEGLYLACETGISEIGMRKVLGLPTDPTDGNYNCGLTKEAEETDDAFAERVSAEVFDRFMYGVANDKQIKIIIPTVVSDIDAFAFITVSMHKILHVGLMNYDGIFSLFKDSFQDNQDMDDATIEMALKAYILGGQMNDSTGEITHYIDVPTLVGIEFAKDENGNRALKERQGCKAFGACAVDSITIPKELVEASIFEDIKISELIFEDDADSIPSDLTNSSKITSITIPARIKRVRSRAFLSCYSLTDIYLEGENVQFDSRAFDIYRSDGISANVYVESLEQWLSFSFESGDASPLCSRNSNGGLGKLYVKNNGSYERIINVQIPNNESRKIGSYAFYNSEIESITIGAVDSIAEGVFGKCDNLKQIKMTRVNSLASSVFDSSGIESVELPSGLTVIPAYAFRYCRSLTTVTFPDDCAIHTISSRSFENCEKLESIIIPASVESIKSQAFAWCDKLSSVTFAAGSKLTEIGERAFAYCGRLTRLNLPSGVKTIGAGAFTQVSTIDTEGKSCTLDIFINGEVTQVGTLLTSQQSNNNPRRNNAYFHCANYDIYKAFTDAYQIESGINTYAIYPIAVDYVYVNGAGQSETVETQRYWYGIPEVEDANQLPYGVAATNVTLSDKSDAWYRDTGCAAQVTRDDVQNAVEGKATALQVENGKITLYMNSVTGYIAKTDIVYDRAKTYMLDDPQSFNALLISDSAELTAQNVLTIRSYADSFGKAAAVPSSVHAAGTYVIAVDNDKTFTLNIARKDIDVSAFDFMVARVGGQGVSQALESATLHLYADKDGATYPSLTPLDDEDLAYYSTVEVSQAFTRFRGEGVAITLEMDCGEYTDLLNIIYGGEYSVSNYGAYTATAEIRASGNYAYTIAQDEEAFAARGISFAQNGDVITVTKVWYVLAMSNWLVTSADATEDDYTLYNFGGSGVFGTTPNFIVPYAVFGDVSADKFGTSEDKLSFKLTYGDVNIGAFDRANYGQYINAAMPTGNYELTVTFGLVGGTDYFSRTFRYTVTAAPLPEAELAALNTLLKGKPFGFDYDNSMHLLTDEVRAAIAALEAAEKKAQPDRTDTVWSDASYNAYYDNFKITFNLDRMRSNKYYTENDLNGEADKPVAPSKYIVYYLVTANNFVPLVSDDLSVSAYDAARRQFVFYVTIIREIDIPTANSVAYNGTAQKADIASSEFYTVNAYDGFTEAGTHSVTLTLVNSEYYRWAGKTLGEETATVSFEIQRAVNDWIEAPDVVRWIEGKYNEKENTFIGAAKFGKITYVITDTNDKVIYDASKGINKLAAAEAGTYILKATVVGNDNYNGLSEAFTIRILEKLGLPWWAVLLIVVGALGVAALIIFILWKKGVFQILTEKIVVSIRTKASVDATIASVRAAKKMEEGKQSVADAKRRERIEQMRKKAAEQRALPPEERAAQLEERAKADEAKAEKLRARSEAKRQQAAKMRGEKPDAEQPVTEEPTAEAAATETQTEE